MSYLPQFYKRTNNTRYRKRRNAPNIKLIQTLNLAHGCTKELDGAQNAWIRVIICEKCTYTQEQPT